MITASKNTSDVHKKCLENMVLSWDEMDILSAVMLPQEMRKPSGISLFRVLVFPILAIRAFFLTLIKQSNISLRPILAVSILGSIFFGVITYIIPVEKNYDNLVLQTQMGEKSSHVMPDGSILWLNSSSTINVNYSTHYRRINLLKGEAHFQVAKDANRPFEVYADNRLVRAIGTAFTVHKIDGKIEVLVSEGKVELAIVENTLVVLPDDYPAITIEHNIDKKNSHSNTLTEQNAKEAPVANVKKSLGTLSAGQRISIPVNSETLSGIDELDNSEITRFLSWKEGKLIFAGESLEEVINEITRHTPVQIDIIDPKLKSMRIGGQFKVGETDTLFYVLESGFGISVNKLNNHHVQLRLKEK